MFKNWKLKAQIVFARLLGKLLAATKPHDGKILAQQARFETERKAWLRAGGVITRDWPITDDWEESAGVASGQYFHQDLLVAQFVHDHNPARHLDVGSSVQGFVAHVASFRQLDVLDIRTLPPTNHPNIQYNRSDLQELSPEVNYDSISCLHALEHFGLGRYGDAIDPLGHLKGLDNLVNSLDPLGRLYLSFPIAGESRVDFNAHRVFHPEEPVSWLPQKLKLVRFDYVDDSGDLIKQARPDSIPPLTYGCGIYTFERLIDS